MNVSLRSALSPVAAVLLGAAFLYTGYGLQSTLVPLRAELEGFSEHAVGLLGSSFYIGFVGGCVLAPYLILSAGHIRAFAAMVSTGSAAALAFALVVDPVAWGLWRFLIGFCTSGLYIIIESWLNDRATNETRGIVMSSYVVVSLVMITVGQLLVMTYPLGEFSLFAIASIMLSLAAVPVALTRSGQPAPIPVVHFRLWRLYRIAPAAFAGALMIGVSNGAFWSLGPVFATGRGLSADGAAIFMSVAVAAGAVGQYPLGRLSDFLDRRKVLLVAMGGSIAASILLWLLAGVGALTIYLFGFLVGAFMLPAYSLAAAHGYDWSPPEQMVETSASIILIFGLGSIVGPPIAAWFMKALGPEALFLFIAQTQMLLAAFIGWRILARPAPLPSEKTGFDIYSTATVGGAITPDPVDAETPMMEMPDWAAVAPEAVARTEDPGHDAAPDVPPETAAGKAIERVG